MSQNSSFTRRPFTRFKAKSPDKYYLSNKFMLDISTMNVPTSVENVKISPVSTKRATKAKYNSIEKLIDHKLKLLAKDLYQELYDSLSKNFSKKFKCDGCFQSKTKYVTPEKSTRQDQVRK